MDEAELTALHARVEAELMKIPGVVGVGFGLKEVDGKTTDQVAFRVYVQEKRPKAEIPPAELIPETIGGYPTDVLLVVEHELLHCQDTAHHSPLIGGISITNFKGGAGATAGTLGFFATINGVAGPENVVLISNNHVLASNGGANGDVIYQPRFLPQPDGSIPMDGTPSQKNPIAKINNIGMQGPHQFTYPGDTARPYYLDCGTAKLDISISSWCNTNCGVSYKNEIRILNIGGNSRIADIGRVTKAEVDAPGGVIVYKVGRTTSRTKGKVVDAEGVGTGGARILIIEPVEADCDGIMRFADTGDSGSAIINEQKKVIGLLYARSTSNPLQILCSHVHPVLDYLSVTAVSVANPPVGPAGEARSDIQGGFTDGINEVIPLRERLRATTKGAELYARALEHRDEVVELVNHCRPVTVAWHRCKGPAFLNRAVNNVRNPDELIPHEIDGIGRADLLLRMGKVLRVHGSDGLRNAIDAYDEQVFALVDTFEDLRELADRFDREAADTKEEVACGAS